MVEISGYEILNKIGEGGMASVFLAKQLSLDRLVAVKVLGNPQMPEAKARFLSEAKTLAAVSHPRVVNVYDVGELADGRLYLVMEYLPGGDLRSLKGQVVEPKLAIEYVRQIAQGLAVIHAKKIIHRDVKPANILVRDAHNVVLSDFGIAKKEDADRDLTRAGSSVGSPAYASPEQTTERALDPRADLYSLGVVFVELLTGHNPFRAASATEAAMKHLQLGIPKLPKPLQQYQPIVNGLLAKTPEQRFGSAEALIHAIDNCAEISSTENAIAAIHRKLTPHWVLASLVACVLVLVWWLFIYESEEDKRIKVLLKQASEKLATAQFEAPVNNNARYFYEQVLSINADNKAARKGLEQLHEIQVKYYLARAESALKENRWHAPENDNAQYYYNKVLVLEPNNAAAQDGLVGLVPLYVQQAKTLLENGEFRRGFQYLQQGLKLDPTNEDLMALKLQYQNQSNGIRRFLDRVFH